MTERMRFEPALSPKGLPPRGMVETLCGCAEFDGDTENGYVYSGYTDMWGDEQRPIANDEGHVRLIDKEGNEWWARLILEDRV